MRISSLSFYTASLPSMQDNQSQIARLSEQISTGQRMLAAKDDPLSAEKAMQLSSRIAARTQYVANQDKASLAMSYESTVLQEMDKTLTDARAVVVQSSGSSTQALRDQNAALLSSYYQHIKDLLNSRDTEGHYIFAGYKTTTQPFSHTQTYPTIGNSSPGTYSGTADGALLSSQGVRSINIDDGRNVQVSDNLENVVKYPAASPVTLVTSTAPNTVATADFLQTLDQIAITLHDSTLTSAQIESNLTSTLNGITAALENLGNIERRLAATQIQVNDTQKTTKSLLLLDQNALSDLTRVDQAAAIVELQSRQTTLQAAQQAYAQTSKLSLFSYL